MKDALKSYQLPAFTIAESITAMVIIMLSFGTGMMIYFNILTSEKLVAKNNAYLTLAEILAQTKSEEQYIDEQFEVDHLIIEKKIIEYKQGESAHIIQLKAFNSKNDKLAELKEIVHIP